jgi:tetratricopeptide (TPR) repeat protein
VLQINPVNSQALLLRSTMLAEEKKYGEAIGDVDRLLKLSPKNIELRLHVASLFSAGGWPRKAISLIGEVLSDDPDNWMALRSRGDVYLSIGDHAKAVADFEKALKAQPENSGILNNFAWVLATSPDDKVRNAKRSIELGTKACELTKFKAAHILSTLASGYAESGDFETAIKWSSKAVELGEGETKEQLEKELESYRQKKPWRELQQSAEKPNPPALHNSQEL